MDLSKRRVQKLLEDPVRNWEVCIKDLKEIQWAAWHVHSRAHSIMFREWSTVVFFAAHKQEDILSTCGWPPTTRWLGFSVSLAQSSLRSSQVLLYPQMCCYLMPCLSLSWTSFYLWSDLVITPGLLLPSGNHVCNRRSRRLQRVGTQRRFGKRRLWFIIDLSVWSHWLKSYCANKLQPPEVLSWHAWAQNTNECDEKTFYKQQHLRSSSLSCHSQHMWSRRWNKIVHSGSPLPPITAKI